MKTYYFFSKNFTVYSLLGVITLVLTSCGTYQNKNYDETDGIYSNSSRSKQDRPSEDNAYYKGYFGSLQDNSQVITDVENYYSETDSIQNDSIYYASRNGGWGSTSNNINVTVYDNNFGWGYSPLWYSGWGGWYGAGWGWNLGWGFNPWYGYGWGGYYNPYWGYGNWGGYHPYNLHYSNGPRYSGNYSMSSGRRSPIYSSGRYASTGRRTDASFNSTGRNSRNSYTVRNSNTTRQTRFTTRNSNTTRNADYNPSRNTTRSNPNYTPTRNNSYTPTRSSSPTRSYTPSSSGGGRSSGGSYGGGGGGRSGGRRG